MAFRSRRLLVSISPKAENTIQYNGIEKGYDTAKTSKKSKNKNKTVIESVRGPHQSVRLARNCLCHM